MDLSARRALLHPAWLAAAGMLVVNDHILKGAGVVPALVTGKLSDFAGLFLAPALLSTLLFARSRRAVFAVHVGVAFAFAAIKVVPSLTMAFEHFLSLFVASRVWTDPTDLVALPAVALSWRFLLPWMEDASQTAFLRKAAQTAACGAGALMCVATSQEVTHPLSIHNGTRQRVTVTVRSLASDVRIDDAIVFSSTPLPFSSASFSPAASAGVLSIEQGGLAESSSLGASILLVDIGAGGKGSQIVLARRTAITAIEIAQKADGTFAVASDGASIRDLSAVKPCAGTPPKDPVYSFTMPTAKGTIAAISASANGCFEVDFEGGQRAHVCMPPDAWPFEVGDVLAIEGIDVVGIANGNGLETRIRVETTTKNTTANLSCAWVDMCGTIGFGAEIELPDGTSVAAGADRTIGNTRFLVGRAQSLAVVNGLCKDAFPNQAVGLQSSVIRIETQSVMTDAGPD